MNSISEILRSGETGTFEFRAMGVSGTGADTVKPTFADSVWKLVLEYQSILADCHSLPTDNGAPFGWPVYSAQVASGTAQTENLQLADGSPGATTPLIAFPSLIQFPSSPTYGARVPVGMALVADGLDVDETIAAAVAEAIGRQIGSVVSAYLYAQAAAGSEVTLTTVTNANLAKLLGKLEPGVLSGAKLYVSAADYALMVADDATKARNYPVPVVVTNAATSFSSGTVSGLVLANLGAALLLRTVQGVNVQISREVYADKLQYGVVAYARADVQAKGQAGALVFSH